MTVMRVEYLHWTRWFVFFFRALPTSFQYSATRSLCILRRRYSIERSCERGCRPVAFPWGSIGRVRPVTRVGRSGLPVSTIAVGNGIGMTQSGPVILYYLKKNLDIYSGRSDRVKQGLNEDVYYIENQDDVLLFYPLNFITRISTLFDVWLLRHRKTRNR